MNVTSQIHIDNLEFGDFMAFHNSLIVIRFSKMASSGDVRKHCSIIKYCVESSMTPLSTIEDI